MAHTDSFSAVGSIREKLWGSGRVQGLLADS